MNLHRPAGWVGIDPRRYPQPVRAALASAGSTAVWHNEIGCVTYELTDGSFLKVGPAGPEWDPHREATRSTWVRQWVSAPEVIDTGVEDEVAWLHTHALQGRNAITCPAEQAVPALGRALRDFHDAVPPQACAWSWSAEDRLAAIPDHVRASLGAPPPIDQLVVCHGDACNPNFLLHGDRELTCTGYVDLADLGLADRWADLAPACLSLGWNFGTGWEATFLDAYGVEQDDRLDWYRRLWEAGD